jgi:hypothetical protein
MYSRRKWPNIPNPMKTPKQIRISKKQNIILITKFETGYYHYHMDEKPHTNPADVGMWKIKYKKI